jgi:hypothetical protein
MRILLVAPFGATLSEELSSRNETLRAFSLTDAVEILRREGHFAVAICDAAFPPSEVSQFFLSAEAERCRTVLTAAHSPEEDVDLAARYGASGVLRLPAQTGSLRRVLRA